MATIKTKTATLVLNEADLTVLRSAIWIALEEGSLLGGPTSDAEIAKMCDHVQDLRQRLTAALQSFQ